MRHVAHAHAPLLYMHEGVMSNRRSCCSTNCLCLHSFLSRFLCLSPPLSPSLYLSLLSVPLFLSSLLFSPSFSLFSFLLVSSSFCVLALTLAVGCVHTRPRTCALFDFLFLCLSLSHALTRFFTRSLSVPSHAYTHCRSSLIQMKRTTKSELE